MTIEIKPYIIVKSKKNGLGFYHYLHIQGGTGHGKDHLGGAHNFYVFYLSCDELEQGIDSSPEFYCKGKGIPCGTGNTIEEAIADFKTKLEKQPLK